VQCSVRCSVQCSVRCSPRSQLRSEAQHSAHPPPPALNSSIIQQQHRLPFPPWRRRWLGGGGGAGCRDRPSSVVRVWESDSSGETEAVLPLGVRHQPGSTTSWNLGVNHITGRGHGECMARGIDNSLAVWAWYGEGHAW